MKHKVTQGTRLQPKMHTLKILFTATSTKCADLGCVEGSISQECTGDLLQVSVQVLLNPLTSAFLFRAWGHSGIKLYGQSWQQPYINIADPIFSSV